MEELKEKNVEKPKKRKNKILYWLVVILGTAFIMIASFNIGYQLSSGVDDKHSSKSNNKEDVKEETKDEQSNKNEVEIDVNKKLGTWYIDETHVSEENPQTITIKNYENDQLLLDLYFTRVASVDNVVANKSGDRWHFKTNVDTGVSNNELPAQITAYVDVLEDCIKLEIAYSNIDGIDKGTIVYNYQKENANIDAYKGEWYISEREVLGENATTMTIKNVEGNKIVFDSYITRTVDLQNVNVYITDGKGTFNISVPDCTTIDEKPGFATGFVTLNNNKVELNITTTNIANLPNGTAITFTYKK